MASSTKDDVKRCIKEIKNCKGMILGENSFLRSITFENIEVGDAVLDHIISECKDLRYALSNTGTSDDRVPYEVKMTYDLTLILNYYKAPLNMPIFADISLMEQTKIAPGSISDMHNQLKENIDFYLVRDEFDLQRAVSKLQRGLKKRTKPTSKKWLINFCQIVEKCLNLFKANGVVVKNSAESAVYSKFDSLICTPIELLFSSFGVSFVVLPEVSVSRSDTDTTKIRTDIVFLSQDICKTFVEMKRAGLELYTSKDENGEPVQPRRLAPITALTTRQRKGFHSLLFQLCQYFRAYNVCACVCSDYKTNDIIQLAFDDEGWLQTDRTSIPIRTKVIDIEDSGLTTQMALCALIWDTHVQNRMNEENVNNSLEQLDTLLEVADSPEVRTRVEMDEGILTYDAQV